MLAGMVRVVRADELQVGDIVHLHTDSSIMRIELATIIRRTEGLKCTGYRADDPYRISPWSFGVRFEQPIELDDQE